MAISKSENAASEENRMVRLLGLMLPPPPDAVSPERGALVLLLVNVDEDVLVVSAAS